MIIGLPGQSRFEHWVEAPGSTTTLPRKESEQNVREWYAEEHTLCISRIGSCVASTPVASLMSLKVVSKGLCIQVNWNHSQDSCYWIYFVKGRVLFTWRIIVIAAVCDMLELLTWQDVQGQASLCCHVVLESPLLEYRQPVASARVCCVLQQMQCQLINGLSSSNYGQRLGITRYLVSLLTVKRDFGAVLELWSLPTTWLPLEARGQKSRKKSLKRFRIENGACFSWTRYLSCSNVLIGIPEDSLSWFT